MSSQTTPSNLMNNYGTRSLEIVRGEGMYLYDAADRQYLDFTAGIAVCALGHAHPAVAEALTTQAQTLLHCSNLYEIPQQKQLATKLAALSGLDQVLFCNSGTEANEAALKLARKYAATRNEPQRTQIVSLPGAFHGRTLGSLSITPKPAYQNGYAPLVPDCLSGQTLEETLDLISKRTAACFVEVVQGEGGVHPLPEPLLQEIAQRCRETGALLVVDEVQTGVGRTGTFYAYEQMNLRPDIVTMAKGLANGVPIGAVLAREEVAAAFTPGSHGTTFGGNPLATSVANVVVDTVSDPAFLQHVSEMGRYLQGKLEGLGTEVSGRGLMYGITVGDAKQFVQNAQSQGVLLTAVGEKRVRFVPPLIVEAAHIDELEKKLKAL